jgi:tRNA (adenine57-N1/adenine58-N1)-methyltransferase
LLPHDEIIGTEEGTTLRSSLGRPLVALRPRLADFALKMPRGAAVVYPKDTGAILVWADIKPGNTVVEAGTGSGALTMALARAVGEHGKVISYEKRADHAELARKRIRGFFGDLPQNIELRVGKVEGGLGEHQPDRVVLDLPEPWHSVPGAAEHLAPGGIFCCYLPTVPQVQQVREAIEDARLFLDVMSFEVMMREWAVDGRSVRPSHRMIGHTGFITVARKREPTGDRD